MDDTRNVGVRFIEPAGKGLRRKEIRLKGNSSINRGNIFVHHLSGFLLSQE